MNTEEIYLVYRDKVRSYIRARVSNNEDAEDICSDVFLKVQKHFGEYDADKGAVSTWIYAMTRNTVIDYYRTRKTYEEVPEELPVETDLGEELYRQETLQELADAIDNLTEEERDVVVLHYYHELTLQEIALKMHLSYGQTKLRHNSALQKLGRSMGAGKGKGGFHIL
ncbi:MAG: sigma-70 family RNA polymerase sigma factor [Lachnospiraceae bacterium]|nr:sigma-70 family RNA polymerase sigma factor [Lachnospiraceae bacterium]